MGLRFVPAPPVSAALRSLVTCLAVCAALGCAGKSQGGPTGGGGSASAGKAGTAGTNGGGTAGTNGSGVAGTTGAGGAGTGAAGTTGSGTAGTSGSGTAGTTGSGVAGTNGSGSAGTTGGAGTSGTGSAGTTGSGIDASASDAACQSASYTFAPKIPTVFVLVDRSGSEFTNSTTGPFFTLRTAVLNVIMALQAQVRFGLGVFTGQNGVMCPIFTTVATDINNYTAINAAYSPLGQPGFKAETPAVQVIPMVKSILQSDTGTGQKYMMFVTDAETDFCDDGAAICPADAVTYEIQNMYAGTPSIGTLIVGLPTTANSIGAAALQAFANAGVGQPVALETGGGVNTTQDVYYDCSSAGSAAGADSWPNLYAAAGHTAAQLTSIATYATTGGTAPVFSPGSTSETDLENAITAAISGVKSCTFDLSDVNGKSLKVDLTKLAQAKVTIEGVAIPLDATNGWNVLASAPSQLVLNGSACTTWQTPNNNDINFAFPCSTIIFE
jgi:hypothetical protein